MYTAFDCNSRHFLRCLIKAAAGMEINSYLQYLQIYALFAERELSHKDAPAGEVGINEYQRKNF
jgi:hypothetical protein